MRKHNLTKKLKRAVNNCENVTTHFSVLVIPKKEGRKEHHFKGIFVYKKVN